MGTYSKGDLLVIGGATCDITVVLQNKAIPADSNPGRIYSSPGGVGRNIAENAARLGLRTTLLTAFGSDGFAEAIKNSCNLAGIDTSPSWIDGKAGSCVYIDLVDKVGELVIAAADCNLIENLPLDYIRSAAPVINGHRFLLLDANLSEEALIAAAEISDIPIISDTISIAKAVRLRKILPRLSVLKTNTRELGALTGLDIPDDPEQIFRACEPLLEEGLRSIYVTMGASGACCADADGLTSIGGYPAAVRNVTGAGDAFCAGVIFGLLKEWDKKRILRFGSTLSHIALESESAVDPGLNLEVALSELRRVPPGS